MAGFMPYVLKLENLVDRVLATGSADEFRNEIEAALNGGSSEALRGSVETSVRREAGAFFTSSALSRILTDQAPDWLPGNAPVLDPTCGAGDLLIRYAYRLPLMNDLESTLGNWSDSIRGYDLHDEFLRATRARLVLVAIDRGALLTSKSKAPSGSLFPELQQGNYRNHLSDLSEARQILVNPPFTAIQADPGCCWASGKVSHAAVVMDMVTKHATPGTRVAAILPDVLRSGRRYERWRRLIASRAQIYRLMVYGAFDNDADVDVFLLWLTVAEEHGSGGSDWPLSYGVTTGAQTVADLFDVRVGPVVPHRDPEQGPPYPYIHARMATPWATLTSLPESRQYFGRVFHPPFVVVRRTSSPRDLCRAIGTIIATREQVAVENHLLVLTPRDGQLSTCLEFLDNLRRDETNQWLNQRIRCRHLTTLAVEELPVWSGRAETAPDIVAS